MDGRRGWLGLRGLMYNKKAACILLSWPLEKQIKSLYWRHGETKASCNRGWVTMWTGQRRLAQATERCREQNTHIYTGFSEKIKELSLRGVLLFGVTEVQNFASTLRLLVQKFR